MDLIYTNANGADQGVLPIHFFDLSYGESENDFELSISAEDASLEMGAVVYVDGTEYGGIVGGLQVSSDEDTATYTGRTWHGMLNSKIIEPDSGEAHLVASGEANQVLAMLVERLGLSALFEVDSGDSGIEIRNYQFHRYCKAYDGIRDMLSDNGAKLKIAWRKRGVVLWAEPVVDYASDPVDADIATLSVERQTHTVNHLVCLGKGELTEREVIHLYVDQFGRIGDIQYYTGLAEIAAVYENTNSENLRQDGIQKLKDMQKSDVAKIDVAETDRAWYDIGDIVGAMEWRTGVRVIAPVSQKIVRIKNGVVSTDYKTGGE